MRGLTVIVATGDVERFRAALSLACAYRAFGATVSVYCHEMAVTLLVPGTDPDDAGRAAAGLASRTQLIEETVASGAKVIACQTGLAAAGISYDSLPGGLRTGGLVSLLADLREDRLVTF